MRVGGAVKKKAIEAEQGRPADLGTRSHQFRACLMAVAQKNRKKIAREGGDTLVQYLLTVVLSTENQNDAFNADVFWK